MALEVKYVSVAKLQSLHLRDVRGKCELGCTRVEAEIVSVAYTPE